MYLCTHSRVLQWDTWSASDVMNAGYQMRCAPGPSLCLLARIYLLLSPYVLGTSSPESCGLQSHAVGQHLLLSLLSNDLQTLTSANTSSLQYFHFH